MNWQFTPCDWMPLQTLGMKQEKERLVCMFTLEGCKSGVVLAPAEAMTEGPWEVFKVTMWGMWLLTIALEQGNDLLALKCLCMPGYMYAVCVHVCV